MKRSRKRKSWLPRRGGDRLRQSGLAAILLLLAASSAMAASSAAAQTATPPRYDYRHGPPGRVPPRVLIITLAGATWSDLRNPAMPNLNRLIAQSSAGLMPAASLADADPYRTYVSLGAGTEAVGGPVVGSAQSADGPYQLDANAILLTNYRARTHAIPGFLGSRLRYRGLTRAVILGAASPLDPLSPIPEIAVLMDSAGRVDSEEIIPAPLNVPTYQVDRRGIGRALAEAISRYDVILLDVSSLLRDKRFSPDSPLDLARYLERTEGFRVADEVIGDALPLLANRAALVAVLCPAAPAYGDPFRNRSLSPIVIYDAKGSFSKGLLFSGRTNTSGIITAADFAPTILAWWGIETEGLGESLIAVQGEPSRLDHLDRVLTDRYRVRVPMAEWYGFYGGLTAAGGIVLALWRRRSRLAGAAALGVAFVPVGLSLAAPVPPGHDALYLFASFTIAVAFGLIAIAAGRPNPAFGLVLVMLLGAALIVSDVLNGSPLMRKSALEMGIMMGSRFYGIGNEYMGALVGMTVIGLGAMMQVAPASGRLAAMIGAFVTLVIGLACWGANWGGSFVAAVGLMVLWLANLPRVKARHIGVALVVLITSIVVPAALDLLNPPGSRSHIGTTAAALLSGNTAGLADTIARKAHIVLKVIRVVPWSILGAALAAAVFWLQLRAGAPARRALAGRHALGAGIAAAIIAGVVAMCVNDSGPAAGFGAILAALGAVVFLAAHADPRTAEIGSPLRGSPAN